MPAPQDRGLRIDLTPTDHSTVIVSAQKWRWYSRVGMGNPQIVARFEVPWPELREVVEDLAVNAPAWLRELLG